MVHHIPSDSPGVCTWLLTTQNQYGRDLPIMIIPKIKTKLVKTCAARAGFKSLNYRASPNMGYINAFERYVRGLYAFSVVTGYTHVEGSG